jgi:hypothetical protein
MARIADSYRFRAEAVRLNWTFIADKLMQRQEFGTHAAAPIDPKVLRARAMDIRLTWACAKELGVPYGPFTVWTRDKQDDDLKATEPSTWWTGDGLGFWWGGEEAARVRVECDVGSLSQPVGLYLFRTSPSLHDAVAAAAVTPTSNTVILDIRTSGATMGLLVNGSNPSVSITRLDEVVNDGAWKPIEIVGLPVEPSWPGSGYDTGPQGPVANLMDPRDAAILRLIRGGPPLGWHPLTQSGRTAPIWEAPDPKALVEEVRKHVLPEIAALYDGSVPEYEQWKVSAVRAVDPPQQSGKQSSLATTVDAQPWATLNLPAHSDAFLNLATGFGSAYSQKQVLPEQIGVGGADFLVTASYRDVLPKGTGSAEFAAYAPQGIMHAQTPAPDALAAVRSGLVPPPVADVAWRETVRLGWLRSPTTAGLGIVTESALARYDQGSGQAEALIEKRDPSGWRPLVVSADAPSGQPGNDHTSVVDGAAEIPLWSGGRQVGYAVAVTDVYGVWSRWSDVDYSGEEPGPESPRIISLALTTTFAGTTTCPANLDLEVATEWLQRRTQDIEIVAIFFPMATPTSAPPAGLSPGAPTPAGCFRLDLGIGFAGDVPSGSGCVVRALKADGTGDEAPGPAQGDGGRRYAVQADVPTLDFATTRRWGVEVLTRRSVFAGPSPSAWVPDPGRPALTSAASPVPVAPIPLPLPPGVPLASLPDAEGRAHARVRWSLPSGAAVRRTAVWECAETAFRQTVGLPPRAPDTDSPGVRLAALWAAYDGMPAGRRRLAFRRIVEVDGSLHDYDAVLPKGSTDIHFFVVTTITDTGIESPWPDDPSEPHKHLQAVMAPRLRRPAPPIARSHITTTGDIVIELSSASPLPLSRFRLLRTRLEAAARRADTMGPAFAEVPVGGPSGQTDGVTGDPIYTASWTGAFPPSWDDWFVRAIAIPVDTVPVQAVRGLPSDASDAITVVVPPVGPPDLAPLVVEATDAGHTAIVVRTSTSATVRTVPAGDHRIGATVNATILPAVPLGDVPETALASPPGAAATEPALERGVRTAGRSPLALWFTRTVATDPVSVAIRLIDPFGRVTERTEIVPGWVPPPVLDLTLLDVIAVVGRGVGISVASDAPVEVDPPYSLAVRASQRGRPFPFPMPLRRPMFASMNLSDIPRSATPTAGGGIQFGWRRDDDRERIYDIWIPLTAPLTATITLEAPDGGQISVTAFASV